MHIPEYSQIVSPLYLVTHKKNDFHWGPEQQQAIAQIKQEIAHAVALGQVAQVTEGECGSSQLAELKAVQLALDTGEREKWLRLYLSTDAWMVANALWSWLERWKKANRQRRWAHDASRHQGRDATYKWARDRGVDLTMDSISQVIHDCERCAAIKQAKRAKPLWNGGQWSKYMYGESWQIDYITLPQTHQGKRYVLTMVEATTGWLET
ncbi:hypothetical protein DUI87_31774 [Hirundo rustica rustica]|uniref:Integrase catalytic domain-containing protein n=1 Tax=Hirundo rustica rustica TaxID=333673 RepID=A0A3M0JB00_HIRRU|nr:hypothetical protein DUI87_31774 [Hirundo rustica rustica]